MKIKKNIFEPICIIVFGNIASGKTTFCKQLEKVLPHFKYVSLDEFRKEVYKNLTGLDKHNKEAIAKKMVLEVLRSKKQVIFETVGIGSFYEECYKLIVSKMNVISVYIAADAQTCKNRYKDREATQMSTVTLPYSLDIESYISFNARNKSKLKADLILNSVGVSPEKMISVFTENYVE
jgi:uridine kinase